MKTIGQRILELRIENDLSYSRLAEAIDVTESYIREMENDKVSPNISVIARMALVFGVSVNKIMTGFDDPE